MVCGLELRVEPTLTKIFSTKSVLAKYYSARNSNYGVILFIFWENRGGGVMVIDKKGYNVVGMGVKQKVLQCNT